MEWALDNTFKDIKIEFEDLDGLSWPKKPAPPQADPGSPPLEPLFGPEKPTRPLTVDETRWTSPASSPTCCQCSFDRSTCQSHPRKFSRSRRVSEINFPRLDVSDPFAFVPIPSGREQESDWQKMAQVGASITRPPSVKQVESPSRPFSLLELPPEPEVDLSTIGPPPGLPSPRPRSQPSQGIPFPTRL